MVGYLSTRARAGPKSLFIFEDNFIIIGGGYCETANSAISRGSLMSYARTNVGAGPISSFWFNNLTISPNNEVGISEDNDKVLTLENYIWGDDARTGAGGASWLNRFSIDPATGVMTHE